MTDTMASNNGVAAAPTTEASMALGSASGAQLGPLATELATRISLGQMAAPTNAAGWKALVDQYTGGGRGQISDTLPVAASTPSPSTTQNGTTSSTATSASAPLGDSSQVDLFLQAVKAHESSGDYTAYNAQGGASGAYQYIQSTWSSYANAAGFGQWANGPASAAPPSVQDAVAKYNALELFNQSHSWKTAAESWYYPAWAQDPTKQNSVPYPSAGNTLTIGAYGDQIVSKMGIGQDSTLPVGSATTTAATTQGSGGGPAATAWARSELGTPYQYGAEQAGVAFDCSGLVQEAYFQAGVVLPRTAQAQYDATTKLPPGTAPQAGDLVFYGQGPSNVQHVGIYIGNGQMIDAPHSGAQVRIEKLWGGEVGFTRPAATSVEQIHPGVTSPQTMNNYYETLMQIRSAMSSLGVK